MNMQQALDATNTSDDLATHYEELRSRALEGGLLGARLGLALLLQQGLAAWMHVWRTRVIVQAPTPAVHERCTSKHALVHGSEAEVVHVLANMALGCLQGVSP